MTRALLLLCAFTSVASADEDPLADARAAAEDLRFEDASHLLDEAWNAGAADPAAVAALAGEISATTGDRAAATRWFSLLVAIDPDAELPAGTSPKVIAVLEDARRALGGARFDVRLRLDRARRVVHVSAVDPLGAVAAIRAGGQRGRELDLPWHAFAFELFDVHGNLLASGRRTIEPLPVAATAHRSWYERWPVWAGVAGGLALTAGGLALYSASVSSDLDALHRESSSHQASEALALERRMKRTAIAAQVAGAGAAVAAAVAILCWRRERNLTVTPTIDTGGAGAVLELAF